MTYSAIPLWCMIGRLYQCGPGVGEGLKSSRPRTLTKAIPRSLSRLHNAMKADPPKGISTGAGAMLPTQRR